LLDYSESQWWIQKWCKGRGASVKKWLGRKGIGPPEAEKGTFKDEFFMLMGGA